MSDLDLLGDLLAHARRAGADAADAVYVAGTALSVQRRLGKIEHVEQAEGRDLGLRVFVGNRAAIVSSSTVDPRSFATLAERAVAMAKVVPEDPYGGLSEHMAPPEDAGPLDLADTAEPDAKLLAERAGEAEEAALSVKGVNNSEGADASYGRTVIRLATSSGFSGGFTRTSHSISATALAGEGTGMQRDYDYSSAVHLSDLEDPRKIGQVAGDKAVARLNPTKARTAKMPVVYDPRVSGGLVGHFSGAINGASVARGTTFLKDRMGQRLLPEGVSIIDDPRRIRGLRSRPFDGEGVPTQALTLVEDGVLMMWLLDSRSARQLGLVTNGRAARGTGGPPGPSASNLYMTPGTMTPAELIADIKEGIYVNELIGMGINGITGDYSRGAAGFMIRDGALAEPVAEITIAGNLVDMFATLSRANDLHFKRGTDAPTIRIEGLTVAGA